MINLGDRLLMQVTLERQAVTVAKMLTREQLLFVRNNVELAQHFDMATRQLVIHLSSFVLANHKEVVDVHERWPADWWQAVRERWAPAWWLRKWPVRYKAIDVHKELYSRTCPHLDIKNQGPHIQFLVNGDGDDPRPPPARRPL